MQVLVFTSADPDYFISHVDLTRVAEYRAEAAKLTGEASIALLFRHLSASHLVTIAQIEGRVRGRGQRVRAGVRHALRRARVGDLRAVRAGVRSASRRRRRPAPHAAHGPRPRARGHVERRGLRRGARRALRLDQPRAARRRARRVRHARSPIGSPGSPPPATPRSRTASTRSRSRRSRTSAAIPISSATACANPRRNAGSKPRSSAASRPRRGDGTRFHAR